ncbi:MAG: HAD hydrolase-like protein [Planctomycetes bacterium]|nr:HAD hydrolase-like protein [Planctomycetota bacterium]
MLVLFDIDGTLLKSEHVGIHAMLDAFNELHREKTFSFEGVEIAGRLDTLIWRDMVGRHEIAGDAASHDLFRETYRRKLAGRLKENNTVLALEGVAEIVERLSREPNVELGLLTGNYPATGRLKVEYAGLSPDLFTVNAFAGEGETRRELPPVALRRYREKHGRDIERERVIIIGDTPHDVDCAHHNGCLCLAVATGQFSVAELQACKADHVVASLSPVEPVVQWLLKHRR